MVPVNLVYQGLVLVRVVVPAAVAMEVYPHLMLSMVGNVKVLFVNVSVVARPTNVSVEVGSVNVPVLLIVEITGEVSVLLVSVKVLDAVATVTPSMVTVPAAERAIVVSVA